MNYKKNFLKSVIFRIDFPIILELSTNPPVEFQKKIIDNFPLTEQKTITELSVHMNKTDTTHESFKSFIWIFNNASKNRKVEISQKHLTVEFKDYTLFAEFLEVVSKVYNSFLQSYNTPLISRFGHRYTNNITIKSGNTFDWSGFINKKLIYVIDEFLTEKEKLSKLISQVIYNIDDYKVFFNYGMHNSDYPSVIGRKEFVLDYDCVIDNINATDVLTYLNIFNLRVNTMFEYCIDDELRKLMEPLDN